MIAGFGERLRYGAYGITAVFAVLAYFWADAESDGTAPSAARRPISGESLPVLRLVDTETRPKAGRDLFAFVRTGPADVETPPVLAAAETASGRPDLLTNLDVIGLVRRAGSVTILLHEGASLITVELGQRFGADDALSVQSIDGRQVLIVDNVSHTSRTFTLTEE
jgi:hypothetical protein